MRWIPLLALLACDDGTDPADDFSGRYEIILRQARADCADAAWQDQPIDAPFFRLAPIEIVGTPLLGYFPCTTDEAESCAERALLGVSFGRAGNGWVSRDGDLRSTEAGCELEMRAGPLVQTADGLELVVSHHAGVLDVEPDACTVDVLETRYTEVPCLDQVRWIARRLP